MGKKPPRSRVPECESFGRRVGGGLHPYHSPRSDINLKPEGFMKLDPAEKCHLRSFIVKQINLRILTYKHSLTLPLKS